MKARRELGRGERVLDGLWRLRLPLPWPGVPHGNAWAIAAGSGVVLVDTGMHEPGSMAQLERAMDQVNLRPEHVRLVACTHAHSDHWGQAATIVDRAQCEFWMHPDHEHGTRAVEDPDAALAQRLEVGRQSGVPEVVLDRYVERFRTQRSGSGVARVIEPDRPLLNGVQIETDLGPWTVYETPGHAPSHVCLYQPQQRILISGDHVLGRISLFYDYGWTPDPVGEFLHSLDVVDGLGARLGLSGHGRPFVDVHGHIQASRQLALERSERALSALSDGERRAVEVAPIVHGEPLTENNASWLLQETLCYLRHLEKEGRVRPQSDGGKRALANRLIARRGRILPAGARRSLQLPATVRIDEILAGAREPVFSFEFFPPQTPEGELTLRTSLEALQVLEPDFASVTYGAGGSTRERTVEITKWIKQELGIEAMAHLSCVGSSRQQLYEILDGIEAAGIDNVLALRGDPPRGETEWRPHPEGLRYSTELAALISGSYSFCIGAACFPEVHPEAPDLAHDLRFLREKIDAGVSFLITQLFFDNELYFRFVDDARAAGIEAPIIPGVMPITNVGQIKTITGMCGATIPQALLEQLEARAEEPDAVLQLGVSYATLQCAELLARGVPGIHFYTLNRSPATRAILSALKLLRPWVARDVVRTAG